MTTDMLRYIRIFLSKSSCFMRFIVRSVYTLVTLLYKPSLPVL
jgi:hypothetical protein